LWKGEESMAACAAGLVYAMVRSMRCGGEVENSGEKPKPDLEFGWSLIDDVVHHILGSAVKEVNRERGIEPGIARTWPLRVGNHTIIWFRDSTPTKFEIVERNLPGVPKNQLEASRRSLSTFVKRFFCEKKDLAKPFSLRAIMKEAYDMHFLGLKLGSRKTERVTTDDTRLRRGEHARAFLGAILVQLRAAAEHTVGSDSGRKEFFGNASSLQLPELRGKRGGPRPLPLAVKQEYQADRCDVRP
jgi:hypothetical protein